MVDSTVERGVLEIFRLWDTQGDGFIDYEEFEEVFVAIGLRRHLVRALFDTADCDRNQRIEYQEFLHWLLGGRAGDDVHVERALEMEEEAADEGSELQLAAQKSLAQGKWRRLVREQRRFHRQSVARRYHMQPCLDAQDSGGAFVGRVSTRSHSVPWSP
eukprot:TRINITY_DN74251_c0_g1_i1.p2 TRINITY_DN74251_c0_g1~~TRINITY_DN74251_c0_g1_i1.p2  ORF type:complete len:159 (+),score=37.10 TRINITY_DN74251_c0_g1_i1:54-530(+)